MASAQQFERLITIVTRVLPQASAGLDIKEIVRQAEADEARTSAAIRAALVSLTGEKESQAAVPMPEPCVLTVEVFHEFELDGKAYDVVEVKWTGKKPPTVEQAIHAADADNHVVRTDEQWRRAHEHRQKLPEKLNGRWVVTARPHPDDPRYVSYLDRDGREWYGYWGGLDVQWLDNGLVLRRRT